MGSSGGNLKAVLLKVKIYDTEL